MKILIIVSILLINIVPSNCTEEIETNPLTAPAFKNNINHEHLDYEELYEDSFCDIFLGVMYACSQDVLEEMKWK